MSMFQTLGLHRLQLLLLLLLAGCLEEGVVADAAVGREPQEQPHFLHDRLTLNVSVQLASTAYLHCQVTGLKDQSVSWYRRKGDEIHLITFGFQTYHNDDRFALIYEQPDDWRLRIRYVQHRDEGTYQCQVATHPPLIRTIHLQVVEAALQILDERGVVLKEKFYRAGSTIELQCHVADVPTATTLQLAWYHNNHRLNYDDSRGGVSVKTELRGTSARSWLRVNNAVTQDSGVYYCNVTHLAATSVTIHVVPDEYPAAIQGGARVSAWRGGVILLLCFTSTFFHYLASSCTTFCYRCFCCPPYR
ncbi:uncharacterized protein LOC121864463 [Homarus americanus]|uniref:uncharacterized protein LOC121864463 n=1 Tax=Homarus americanus TaxID=6706 RepID=UPI001C47E8DB|nr:uncharacterized protein LOC121864463 [Homarus americanus]